MGSAYGCWRGFDCWLCCCARQAKPIALAICLGYRLAPADPGPGGVCCHGLLAPGLVDLSGECHAGKPAGGRSSEIRRGTGAALDVTGRARGGPVRPRTLTGRPSSPRCVVAACPGLLLRQRDVPGLRRARVRSLPPTGLERADSRLSGLWLERRQGFGDWLPRDGRDGIPGACLARFSSLAEIGRAHV